LNSTRAKVTLVVLFAVLVVVSGRGFTPPLDAQVPAGSIVDLGGPIHEVAVDEAAGTAYISVPSLDKVVVVDMASGAELSSHSFSTPRKS